MDDARRIRQHVIDDDYTSPFPSHTNNGEEEDYRDEDGHHNYIANFSKGLPHNSTLGDREVGEVDPKAYGKMLLAINTEDPSKFEQIPLADPTDPCARKLTNPQAGLAFDLESRDSHSFVIPSAPRIDGPEAAGEMAELYWMALARDVNFSKYDTDSTIGDAVNDLASGRYSEFPVSPYPTSPITRNTIFRGYLIGDLIGPFVSQFLLRGNDDPSLGRTVADGFIKYGTLSIDQRQETPKKGIDFITDFNEWLRIQNGHEPRGTASGGGMCVYDPNCGMQYDSPSSDGRGRFIRNLRDLTNYVHFDDLPQEFLNACLILKHLGVPLNHGQPCSPQPHGPVGNGNPYLHSKNQEAIGTFGDQYIFTLVGEVARRAIYAAWFQKWFVHRRLRPEVFGALIHRKKMDPSLPYPINSEILNSQVLPKIQTKYGSYLLPQAYVEGSTLHPSYPSGHATIAGACVTILKAYFDESFAFPNPVIVDPSLDGTSKEGTKLSTYSGSGSSSLTVGGELNKLASNIAIGRNAAGIHYRSDYVHGVLLGEAVAIGLLKEQLNTYNEEYSFTFTKFKGGPIVITNV